MATFTSFKSEGLISKKEWVLSDKFVSYMKWVSPLIAAFMLYQIYVSAQALQKYRFLVLAVIVYFAYMIADYISAFYHCYYVDKSFSSKNFPVEDGYIIVDTTSGYASCHHIFPSGWKDIPDETLLITALSVTFPVFLFVYFLPSPTIQLTIYLILFFLNLILFAHKYAHEKLHGRYVPWILDPLLEWGILLNPKVHQKHHTENNYNWALLHGHTDVFFNQAIRWLCKHHNKCPNEESIQNIKIHAVNGEVKLKFIGDIEGILHCEIKNTLIIKKVKPCQ